MIYAIISGEAVINRIEYDNPPSNPPPGFPDGVIAIPHERASVDWKYSNNQFIEPNYTLDEQGNLIVDWPTAPND